jgi:hypothetical protein
VAGDKILQGYTPSDPPTGHCLLKFPSPLSSTPMNPSIDEVGVLMV